MRNPVCLIITAIGASVFSVAANGQSGDDVSSITTPRALSRQQGDKRPEGQYETLVFNRPLTIGGEFEFNPEWRRNLNLSDGADTEDSLTRIENKLEIEAFYDAGRNVYVFAESKVKIRHDSGSVGRDEQTGLLERGETWAYFHMPDYHVGIQVGRQSFKDKREWWWDADLDAVRLRYQKARISAELAVAQELASVSTREPLDPEEEDVFRLIGNAQWRWADRQTLDVFWLSQSDGSSSPEESQLFAPDQEDEVDADLNWFGIRARGTYKLDSIGRFYYWADIATVRGSKRVFDFDDVTDGLRIVDDIDDFSVRGTAYDVGATLRWRSDRLGEINLTAGIAVGSGDDNSDDDRDESFHQTGLQDNNGKFRGESRFRYYGELFRPELSNMRITTLSIGRHIRANSSIEFAFHDYRQLDARAELRDSRLRTRPDGVNRQLGREIDVVVSLEEWIHWELEVVAAVFQAGAAFGEAKNDRSFFGVLKVNYNF